MKTAVFLISLLITLASASVPVYSAPDIASQTGIVIDFETGEVLFEKNALSPFVPASMTKVLTAFIVYEEIEKGNQTLSTLVYISENAARASREASGLQGQHIPLNAGSLHSVDTLLHLAMLPSSNGACVALAEHIEGSEADFVARMNSTMAALGLFSEFVSVHGACSSREHVTNAYSVAFLTRTFIQRFPDILRITSTHRMDFGGRTWNNTNRFIRPGHQFFWRYADGFKTGTTWEAGFCLISTAARDGRRVIAVTMAATSNDARYGDSRALLEFGLAESAERAAAEAAGASTIDYFNIFLE